MKIYVLTDNETKTDHIGTEHGLSLFVDLGDRRILFDLGQTDLYRKNAKKMGVDLSRTDYAVISHGHYDHGGSLADFLENTSAAPIYVRSNAFDSYYSNRGADGVHFIGLPMPSEGGGRERIIFTGEEYEIEPGIMLFSVPEIKMPTPLGNRLLFEKRDDGKLIADEFLHEQNVLIQRDEKSLLIAGCAHRGIPNILEWVKDRFGFYPQYVMGGFHLSRSTEFGTEGRNQLDQFGEYLNNLDTMYYTGHCTGMKSYRKLKSILGDRIEYAYAGSVINIPDKEIRHE
ncbi:MAG: MBL fold metallo-hydrolase [Clostridiales bacterium]|nr:MBL fold metallo-hydrolase [Clostridiales bacterium]